MARPIALGEQADLAIAGGKARRDLIASLELDPDSEVAIAWKDDDFEIFQSLTPKQRRFVLEYVMDFNQTRAVKAAGYNVSNDKHAQRLGYTMLRHPKMGPLIQKASQQTADELGITRGWLLDRVRDLAADAEANGDRVGASRAYALLAKLRGDMIERKEVDMKVVQLQVNGVDLGDLR
jgi:hypothetical protein